MADKNIGSLPAAENVADDALLVAEIQGVAVKITGEQLKALVKAGVEVYVSSAQKAAEDAQAAAEAAKDAVEGIGTAVEDTAANAKAAMAAQTGAERAQAAIENLSVEGESIASGQSITVSKVVSEDGTVTLKFYIPQGEKGEKGDTGGTGPIGPQGVGIDSVTVTAGGDLTVILTNGTILDCGSVIGPTGPPGPKGDPGNSIQSIERTDGTGAAGTVDTYTITLTDSSTGGTFQVYNGADGQGAGDMTAAVYDPQGRKTDIFKYVDDKLDALVKSLSGVFLVKTSANEVN